MDHVIAFDRLMGHEGDLSMAESDRGNWTSGVIGRGQLKGTRYGISAMAYPGEDIEHLTLDRARALYVRDYWGPAGCDAVPDELKFHLFDAAVNSGVASAIKFLQRALGEHDDGILGPATLQAVQSQPVLRTVARFNGYRLQHMASAPGWPTYGRGWALRVAKNQIEA